MIRQYLFHGEWRSVERVGLIAEQVPGDCGPVNGDFGRGQNDGVHHDARHDGVDELVRGNGDQVFVRGLAVGHLGGTLGHSPQVGDQMPVTSAVCV